MKPGSRALPLAALLILAGCTGTDASPAASPSAGARIGATPATPPSVSAAPSASPAATSNPTDEPIADEPPPLALAEVAAGLEQPVNITAAPDGWLLVNERVGRVTAVDPASGTTGPTLDIAGRVGSDGSEQGLLGLALHPDWPGEPRAFVHYTDRNGDTVLSEFAVTDEPLPPRLDATTERVLLQVDQPYRNHNGGQLAFGPDGYLYIALGDGGSGGDPHGHGQNAESLLGSILRIDVDAEPAGERPYAIPDDNPFADGDGGAAEVFAYGLRNPWRFSFDRASGQLWIGDVGQNAFEEIDRIDPAAEAGANLGWSVMEASHCFATAQCATDGLTMPIVELGREGGNCSITGGFVYRGAAIEQLRGWYLFSDYCSGTLFGVRSDATGVVAPRSLLDTGARVSTFGEGPDGELYLADLASGTIYRIVAGR